VARWRGKAGVRIRRMTHGEEEVDNEHDEREECRDKDRVTDEDYGDLSLIR
jgi:hypothetical protein